VRRQEDDEKMGNEARRLVLFFSFKKMMSSRPPLKEGAENDELQSCPGDSPLPADAGSN